ncbi:histidinol dehydrogenase [Candidatus Poribacteria bacterium]|jgi:histidinol dehydrogenase|nr:histidinol dehydrogenase [Candidatus Poribacteria bacterium]MBT5711929.1 histidinol dehydrogenase [Candidatus Poribacteria bacterium]MBT7099840.1 histidinol dehydrogenase [Candidatus Poribacteria bacterium]MBT7804465.1 histidinol dehydrogenase [Candidatus Poribacteria bacterium]
MIPVMAYPSDEADAFLLKMASRGHVEDEAILNTVRGIIQRVRSEGDSAVVELTRQLDCPDAEGYSLRVSESDIERAYAHVSDELLAALRLAIANVREFHEHQRETSWFASQPDGVLLGQMVTPLRRVGLVIPAAQAPLVSTLMMAAIPARVAGVTELIATVAPRRDGHIDPVMLVGARECHVDEVYACGGSQAVAAMAYGTDAIARVDKVVGPGNMYSQFAKREVFGVVDVDKIAGPSEILVIADGDANAAYIAADLISQAEHSDDCSAVLVTTSPSLAEGVRAELGAQAAELPREDVIRASLDAYGGCLLVDDLGAAIELANEIAPEHAEVHTREPYEVAMQLRNVGGIFIGEYAPEALGDYAAGPNHILPTGGAARFSSAMSVTDFLKRSNLLGYSRRALDGLTDAVVTLARAEGLAGHAAAMEIRRK